MAITGGPDIVSDGLVLSLDGANSKSYPGTGTTWFDLSGNGNTGTLTNGPTFDSGNGGSIVFDGINDVVSFGTGNTFFPLPQFTIDIWFKSFGTVPTTGVNPGLFGFTFGIRAVVFSSSLFFGVDDGATLNGVSVSGTYQTDGKWYNSVFYHTGSNMGIYINGNLAGSVNRTWSGATRWPTNSWNLGRDNNNANQYFPGQISSYKMYNRALTPDEVLRNFNQTRSRFGI